MNLIFFFFLNCKQRLKRRRLILVRLSLNMRPLGWALLWDRSRCLWLNTASLVFLEQNLAMMAGCGFLSVAGDSLWETLISSAFKSTPTIFETRRTRSSVFSFLFQASPWNSRHSRRPYCSRSLTSSWVWLVTASEQDPESDFLTKTGPGTGAGVRIFVFYRSRIINFIKFKFSLNGYC